MATNFTFTADNKEVMKAITEVTAKIDNLSRKMQAGGKTTDKYFQDLEKDAKGAAGGMKELIKQTAAFAGLSLGAAGVAQFAKSIVDVRKQMQSLQVSFKTLLGSEEKANKMFGELKQFAATTPLMLKDLAAGAQTMLGFNIEAEKVVPTLKAIGDISMGDAQKFQSLTLAFSQMSATGKLMGQDLLQMINAGFNPLTEISRKTGKSIATLKDEMSKGAISADMVADAFKSATSEGGKFNGMLEEQGKTLAGAMNQLQGAIDDMFNSIGEQTEGVIAGAISATQKLVENYEKVGKILTTLIATYGAYKAAVMAANAIEMASARGWAITRLAMLESIKATKAATVAQKAFNAAAKANPYVLLATTLVAAVGVVWALRDNLSAAERAQRSLNEAEKEFTDNQGKDKAKAQELIQVIRDETSTQGARVRAYKELIALFPQLEKEYTMEAVKAGELNDIYKSINKVQEDKQRSFLTNRIAEIDEYLAALRKAKKNGEIDWMSLDEKTANGLGAMGVYGSQGTQAIAELEKQRRKLRLQLKDMTPKETKTDPEKQNKEYWEKQKKAAETELAALTDIEAKGEKGAQIKKRINAIDEKLNAYNPTKEQKDADQRRKQQAEINKMNEEAAFDARQAEIDGMEEGTDKVLEQLKLDHERKLAEINRENEELMAKSKDFKNPEDKKKFEAAVGAYTQSQKDAEDRQYKKSEKEAKDNEEQKMREYLIAYGAMQEKRLAITKEYQDKINKAQTEGEKKALQEEMKQAISTLDMSEFKDKVNWEVIFGDLNSYTKKQLNTLKKQLQDFKKTDGYTQATIEDKKAVDDALNALSDEILNKGGIFGGLAQAFEDLAKAEQELTDATTAVNNTTEGTKEHEEAVRRQNQAQGNVTQAEGRVRTQAEKTRDSIAGLASQITALGTASEMTLTDLGSVASGIASAFGEAGQKAGGWIAAAFTIADMIAKDGIKGFFQNVSDLVVDSVGGLFGYDQHAATRYYEDQKKIHDNYISLLEEVISEQETLIKRQTGIEAVNTYEDAKKKYEVIQATRLKDINNFLNSGASAGSHSHGYKLNRKLGTNLSEIVGPLAEILGVETYQDAIYGGKNSPLLSAKFSGRMTELANVNVEQIKAMKEIDGLWEILPDEVRDYYQEILDAEKAMEDLKKTTDESLTQTTFDDVRSAFMSNLKSMKTSAQDWADSFEDMMRDAVINAMMVNNFDDAIQAWYDDFSDMMGDEDGLTAAEKEALQASYNKIVDDATALRDNLYDTLGIDDSQSPSATQGIAASFSQDSIDEANGRMAALQMGQQQQITHLNTLVDLAGLRNSYIQDIYTRLGQMQSTIDARLKEISTNTSNL